MNQQIELSPLTNHYLELGRRVYDTISEILQNEEAYRQAGPQRSAEVALSLGLDSLKVQHRMCRAVLWVEDRYRWERFGDDSIRKVLATARGIPLPASHTQVQTTARYAHLYDDSLREAAEKVGAVVALQRQENQSPPRRESLQ